MATKYQENVVPAEVLTSKNAALLLIDHQVGLMQLVRDMTPEEYTEGEVRSSDALTCLRNNERRENQ